MRALHTCWEGGVASLIVTLPQIIDNLGNGWGVLKPILISAGIGFLGGCLSALKTGIIAPWLKKRKEEGDEEQA